MSYHPTATIEEWQRTRSDQSQSRAKQRPMLGREENQAKGGVTNLAMVLVPLHRPLGLSCYGLSIYSFSTITLVFQWFYCFALICSSLLLCAVSSVDASMLSSPSDTGNRKCKCEVKTFSALTCAPSYLISRHWMKSGAVPHQSHASPI